MDTSCRVAIAFGEPGSTALARRLDTFEELVSSNLLEAELCSAFLREAVEPADAFLKAISWVVPDRPLHAEITTALAAGQVRGADCWHLASALYLAQDPTAISFLTLDARQRTVALALGFRR